MRPSNRLPQPRIAPVPRDAWTPEQKAILEPYEKSGRLWNVFTTFANHPALAKDWLTFATHVLRRNTLPPRERELLILRMGEVAGLTDHDIERIAVGPTADGLNDNDRLLLEAVDQLHANAMIATDTWNALAKIYDQHQMMDLVFTVGQYNLVSMALNSFGVQLDEGLDGFPK